MQSVVLNKSGSLLCGTDPAPAEIVNSASAHDVVLVCEHAGRAIPSALGDMGLSSDKFDLHIAYDIGAGTVSREMARRLGAPLVLQPYSRLVVDCNRPADSDEVVPEFSDGTEIPANFRLDPFGHRQRIEEIFNPFQQAVSDVIDCHPRRLVVAIHSFTPVLAGEVRPWDIAFLFRKDVSTSRNLAAAVGAIDPELKIGMNQPYTIEDSSDWFVPYHGERRGVAHSLIEIRNDHLASVEGCKKWAGMICRAIEQHLGGQGS